MAISSASPAISIPPLENGDILTREEYERRYSAMPNLKKAELIEGIVYMASPLRFEPHAEPHAHLMIWLGIYKVATSGLRIGDNATVRLDLNNEPQPDIVLLIDQQYGGQTRISEDGYIEGAPELVVEIAASTATIDLRDKKRAYCRNKVQEYLVWQVFENRLDWFVLENEEYIAIKPNSQGILQSRIFPGLWLDVEALLRDDMAQVLATQQLGLTSPEYLQFKENLRQ
ncbi:MAG: Uma2 family endonuclease [Snowella sp.]|nr:Uma2 family endonuclease [Snowella sp.]